MTEGRAPRRAIAAVVCPVLALLAFATVHASAPGLRNETPCWLLPNLRVLPVPGSPDCPLRPHDAIRSVQTDSRSTSIADLASLQGSIAAAQGGLFVGVSNAGEHRTVYLPIRTSSRAARLARVAAALLVSALFLSLPIFLLWRSTSNAAAPLATFYSAFCVALIGLIAGRDSTPLTLAAVVALGLVPATLFHLGLRFPRDRPLAVEFPAIPRLPYLASVFVLALGWVAIYREPLTWPAFALVLVALASLGWVVLMAACWFAMRESHSPLERARSRLVLYGSALLPILPTAALAALEPPGERGIGVLYLWSAAATMPLPIGLAISRYNLFDLGLDIRQGVARGVYGVVASLAIAAILWSSSRLSGYGESGHDFAPILIVSLLCVAVLEPLRRRIPGLLESTLLPRLQNLSRIRRRFEQEFDSVSDEDSLAIRLGDALVEGIAPRSGSVFLCRGRVLSLAHAFGPSPPTSASLAAEAADLFDGEPLLQLAAHSEAEIPAPGLRSAGVEVAAQIGNRSEGLGLVLLCGAPSGRPLGGIDLDFITALCAHASMAIRRSRVQLENLAHERAAAAGRIAIALAHDTGKDVAWLRRLARRLPQLQGDEERWKRDAQAIGDLSEELAKSYERVMREAATLRDGQRLAEPRFDELMIPVFRRIRNLHGDDRLAEVLEPALRNQRLPEFLGRAIGNVLDNAVRASPRDVPVRLHAALEGNQARITIEDEGPGIPDEIRSTLFEAGVSTRPPGEGSGVGLTVAAEILDMLGGSITLEPGSDGSGTRATIRVPLGSGRPTHGE